MAKTELPSIEDLRKLLSYDPETGALTWRARTPDMFKTGARQRNACAIWNARFAGKPALATVNGWGYCHGDIFGRLYKAHRVAWALHFGEWPSDQIDHKNGDRADNRVVNLRAVTNAENGRNQRRPARNTSGRVGVAWHRAAGKWRAYIKDGGRQIQLGSFDDFADACAARAAAEVRYGFHPNHGRAA